MYQKLLIHVYHSFRRTLVQHNTLIQKNNTIAVFGNASQVVTYKQNSFALFLKFLELMIAFRLKKYITYRKCFIHYQDLRIYVDSHSKGQAYKHTTGVGLYRLMDKVTNICKTEDFIQPCVDFFFGKA